KATQQFAGAFAIQSAGALLEPVGFIAGGIVGGDRFGRRGMGVFTTGHPFLPPMAVFRGKNAPRRGVTPRATSSKDTDALRKVRLSPSRTAASSPAGIVWDWTDPGTTLVEWGATRATNEAQGEEDRMTEGEPVALLAALPVIVELPVVWGEMDAYRHVNNAVYFRYFESARLEYFRRLGW